MNQTYQLLTDQLRADISSFKVGISNNDYRILAEAVKRLIKLDSAQFEQDYLELISILNFQDGDLKIAMWGLEDIEKLSRQRGLLDDPLCDQIKELHQLISKALYPSK